MKLLHLQLFWYEYHHTLLEMEDLPVLTPAQMKIFQEWVKTRRKLLKYEVHQQVWVKTNVDGASSILTFSPDGTLTEQDLFGSRTLNGLWKVIDGFLFIKVISGEFIVEYQISGITEYNIHSGIEYINGQVTTYSKFIQTKVK
ncbi:hypothetical protein VA7868_03048 [Vibrio aerogenes CECT 7868]|uniref:Uncharacterized protein n=1 Tax=Vibrio aerogenes CECT 7868 TaxID=1216006 RepID=A0A1M5ZQA2_9VIBR|nr:hypothetical protein [Vibrio aerogenes]SHI26338.1 hypothetical protein VA7868_03048 [Vibrio aerogenes CECT 7868]